MNNYLQYLTRRLIAVPLTLLIVTLLLYGVAALAPVEVRAKIYWPPGASQAWLEFADVEKVRELNERVIKQYGLNDPFLVQYGRWLGQMVKGDWGSSITAEAVLPALLQRTPVTLELTIYAVCLLIPIGLASGVIAGWKKNKFEDYLFRAMAFFATSIPPFILALLFLVVFYVLLRWFPPGRISGPLRYEVNSPHSSFIAYTGMITFDGILNGRLDVTLLALRHLTLPVLTLSLVHWATLGRITRAAMIEELGQQYITAARGRGISQKGVIWRHAFRNAILPGLNSSAVAAASMVTGVFVIERIFEFNGLSELLMFSVTQLDLALTLGLAIYSVLLVLPLMFILDIIQAAVDPRVREEAY